MSLFCKVCKVLTWIVSAKVMPSLRECDGSVVALLADLPKMVTAASR